MQGLISPLDEQHDAKVQSLWQKLRENCGLQEVLRLPLPHLTWHVADQYDLDTLTTGLAELTQQQAPLMVQTNGLGLFTGPEPVLYLPVIRTAQLSDLQTRIRMICIDQGQSIPRQDGMAYYTPPAWLPHITLAHTDTNLDALRCAMMLLLPDPLIWEVRLDQLLLVEFEPGSHAQVVSRFFFKGAI